VGQHGRAALIQNKRASGRAKDLLDLELVDGGGVSTLGRPKRRSKAK
jgi:hypothetical protein